jgi:phenylalanyl-tRNA synthetase beta chain
LLFSLKVSYVVEKGDHPSFIKGRVGKIYVDGDDIGLIGEFHPNVLLNHGLEQPVVGFELDISRFIGGP